MSVITDKPVTHQLANIYHPNMVLNQCVSMLMIQSQADTEDETANIIRKIAESLRAVYQCSIEPSTSSASISFLIQLRNKYHKPKKITILATKKIGKLPAAIGQ